MSASAPALPREEDVLARIRKIRAFGRNARTVCAVLLVLGPVGIVFSLAIIFFADLPAPNSSNGGVSDLLASLFTPPQLKALVILSVGLGLGIWLAAVRQLHRLFGNLAGGAIYTPENVRRVRNVGLLWLLLSVLNAVLPATLVVANGFLDAPAPIDLDRVFPSFGELLSSFAAAGLILLASWVMDVGLYEKEHADALRREADFVI